MDIRKSKNFAKVVQHSGAAERVAEDTRKNSRFYDPKKKRYEYDDPEEEIADVLARNSYRRNEVPEYHQQTPEESLAQRRQIIRAADDRSDLERLQDERRSYARQYGGQTRNTIDKLIGIALERTDSERAAKMQEEANRHMAALDEYDKKIQEMEEYERRQKIVDKYSDIPNQKDFADKSKQIDKSSQDSVYRAVNGLSESVGSAVAPVGASGIAFWGNRMNKAMDDTKYNQMTDEQRGVFNYLYNTDGAEAAHEYLSAINKDLERKATDATVLSQRKMAQDGVTGAILANAATVGENLMNAPGYIVDAAAKAVGGSVGDTYDLANLAGKMSSDTRKTTGEAIAKQDFWKDKNTSQGNIGTWIYDTGMSMADSVASMAVGQGLGIKLPVKGSSSKVLNSAKKIAANASSLIMASQKATQTVTDMKEQGFSDDRALGVGALYGAVEYISEKLGLGAILGAGGNVFARLAKSFAAEGSEEVASNILDRIVDTLANGNQSKMMAAFDECRAQGLSNSQALAKVVSMAGQEDLSAFLAGGLSGMAMSGANEAIMSGERHLQQDIYGKNLRRSGNAGELIDAGLTADKNSKLYRIAAELADAEDSGKTISKRQLGKLAMEMQTSDDAATTQAQKTVLEDAVRQRLQDSGVKNVDKATSRFVSSYFDGEGKIKGDKTTKALYAELQGNSTDWAQSTTRSMAYEMLRGGSSAAYMNELLVNPKAKGYNEFKDTYGGITEAKIAQLEQERLEQEPAEQRETEHGSADTSYNALVTETATPVDWQRAEPVPESQVKGVLKVQDGHTVVELQDGTKTTTDYLQFNNPNTKAVYKSAAKFGSLGAYALVKNYDSKVNPYSYLHAAENFYNAGASGKITFDQAANTLSAPIEMGIMDRGAANELFLSGQEQSKEIGTTKTAVTQANKNQGGVVTLTGEATVTPQEKEVLDRVAAKTKLDIVLDGSLESNDNGYIDPANGKVVLNPDSGHIYATLMHELGEYTHAYNTAEMLDACRPIVEYMLATGDYAHDDKIDLLQKYVDGYSENGKQYSIEDAVSEMIFDFISGEASTQEGGEKFAKWLAEDAGLTQKEKKSVIEKIKDFFAKLLDAVRSVIEGQGTLNTAARAGQKAAQQVPVLDDFFNALDNAIDNRQRMLDGDTAQKNSTGEKTGADLRFSIDPNFEKVYDQWDKKTSGFSFRVGTTSKVLQELGVDNRKIWWDASKIKKIKVDHPAMTDTVIKQVPNILENPILVMESKTKEGRLTLFGEVYDQKNEPVLAVLLLNPTDRGGNSINILKVASAYGKDTNPQGLIDNSKILYVEPNKKRTQNWLTVNRLQLPLPSSSYGFINTIVANKPSGVNTHSMQKGQKNAQNGKKNTRHSLEVDSQGNELTEAQQRRYKHVAPELRDEDGKIKPFYHGTARADRVGYVFDPKRATSGPMAYFTDDPDIATNYSRDKADTSLAYDSDYDSYETQFQVNGKPVTEYWNTLTATEKKAMTEKIKQVTLDDNDNIVLKPGNQIGIGSFSDYELHRAKGNALSVLVDMWLGDGNLWNEESRFLDVLKAVGIDQAQYNDPDYREEKVYQAYLNITNPYNTGKLDQSFIDDLQSYVDDADMSRYDTDNAQADMWDKNGIPIEDWLERLQDDLDNGTTHAWTTVPDVVTDFLKDSGYDGIVDQGGKNGGDQHTVAIPFYSNQIKEVTNGNPTDSPDIRYSKQIEVDEFDEAGYDVINTTGKKGYADLKREVMTWDADRHMNEVRCITIGSGFYVYKMLDTPTRDILVYKPQTATTRREFNEIRKITHERKNAGPVSVSAQLGYIGREVRGDSQLSGVESGQHKRNASGTGRSLRGEGNGNRGRSAENVRNDQLQKGLNADSRKSKSIDDTGRTSLLRDDKRLDEMNITLRQVFDSQELETGHHTSQTQVQRVARQLKKSTGSKMDTPRLMVQLKGLFDYIGNNDDVTFSSVMDQAKEIAHELLDSTPEHTVRDEYAQEVLDTLRGMAITLSDEQKAETAYHHDRYGNYRKRLFGAVNLAKNGQSLDSAWQELAELYPGTFDAEENSQNMPERLLEIVEELKDSYYSYDGMDMDDAATTVAYDIFDAYMDTPEYKTYAQRQNDRFTAMQNKYRKRLQSVKDDYRQRYEEKLKTVQSKSRQDKADMRTQYADQLKAQRQLYAERRHRDVEKRRKTVQKNKIKKQILDLMSLAANGGKERRVPNGLLDSVKELGRAVVLDGKAGERLDGYLNKVRDGFDKIEGNDSQKTEYATLVEDYNNLFKGQILQLKESIGDKSINDMTADELEQTYQLIRSVKKAVTNSNRLFKAEKTATVESQGQQIIHELKGSKKDPNGKKTNERIEFMKGFGYNALKPEYFFRMQGSPTLEKLYHNLRGGQDTWARDCYDARQYSQRLKEKYHAYNWNQKRTFTLETQYGESLKFNMQQLLYLYALSRREPAMQHLTQGGMVFDKVSTHSKRGKRIVELTDNTAHPLTVEDIAKATDMLTKEQKAYAQDMQRYLADTMGAKGNEVSRVMYDMDLFTDSDYIPMRSAGDYVQYIQDKANGDAKIKNSGFTNQLNVHANNALVISSFDDVWANHVNDMALYHAFTLPLEDFQRVYNYHTQVGENGTVSQAVRGYMDTESKRYIEQFIRDLNGGVRPDNGSRYVNKGISLFKKGAVFASASVAIQQPSAIARAMAVIPAKHFVATTVSKRDYAQLKKYAPVAIVKEMGYFDTGMGKTATDWINEDKPRGFGKKLRALVTDSDYRDSVLSALPEKADELTWAHIWNACVHEAKTDFHLTGEAAYQKAGERFSEVVDRTQVYDSVFSRSGMMRSSDNAMKMATAFMAEPTTSLNMLVDAVYQVKNGNAPKSYGTRVVGSLVAAAALNAILQSIVTAARDDDDDKTYLEVYLGQLLPNMWSNLNPAGQIPMLKDVVSIFQGYDVSRADMNLFADLYDAVQAMDSDTISTGQKINRLAGALSAFVGLPYKNVARDVQSVFNVIHKATLDMHTGATGTKEVFNDEMKGQLLIDDLLEKFGIEMFPDTDKSAKLYKAVSTGDQETVDRMQREAGDDETFNRMLVAAVKANDQNAGKAAQAHLEGDYDGFDARLQDIIKLGFSDEIAVKAVDGIESAAKALVTAKENDDGTEEYKAEYKEKFDQVVAAGFDAKALEKYVSDHVDTSNEPKGKLKSRYDYSDVALAISKNDNSGTKRMRQDLINTAVKNGYTKDKAEDMVDKAIRREFAKSDERLLRAAEAYKVGAFDTYEANVRAIASDDYFTMDEVATMAKGHTNKTGIPYSSSDVVKAMDTSSGKVKSIISQLEKAGKAGKDGAYIKSRITAAYKDKYIKGDETTRRNIRQKMYNTGLYTADEIYNRTNAWLKSK
jgi:carbonic anhydrase